MLTVMCPNCHHRFPAPGCCETHNIDEDNDPYDPTTCYYGGLLVPKSYPNGCPINAPTIIHSQPIINTFNCPSMSFDLQKSKIKKQKAFLQRCGRIAQNLESPSKNEWSQKNESPQITSCCELTGGSVTITTPNVQSEDYTSQSADMKTQHMEIRPKLSGGACFVQNNLPENRETPIVLPKCLQEIARKTKMFVLPPSGCQELPGSRKNISCSPTRMDEAATMREFQMTNVPVFQFEQNVRRGEHELEQNRCYNCCCNNLHNLYPTRSNRVSECSSPPMVLDSNSGVQIQLNATVQLPAHLGQCTVNITASTNPPDSLSTSRTKNNLTGGGLVQKNERQNTEGSLEERRDRTPTTPVSWLMPCPWTFDNLIANPKEDRLSEIKRLFETCGWYHEGLSWQQSENLLKKTSIGRWLIRDSSDSRYMFAVSVQTARGPTSVRVHNILGQFRLDAEPSLAFAIPLFDCPIKMLEYYVEYSKCVDERRKEVWVDYTGQLYSEIYLTKPLVKEVRSLSHLARLAVNRYKLPTEHLPPLIRNYLAEYPYTI